MEERLAPQSSLPWDRRLLDACFRRHDRVIVMPAKAGIQGLG
jgi:hypothetical protein